MKTCGFCQNPVPLEETWKDADFGVLCSTCAYWHDVADVTQELFLPKWFTWDYIFGHPTERFSI
jgi:hypothetical protein